MPLFNTFDVGGCNCVCGSFPCQLPQQDLAITIDGAPGALRYFFKQMGVPCVWVSDCIGPNSRMQINVGTFTTQYTLTLYSGPTCSGVFAAQYISQDLAGGGHAGNMTVTVISCNPLMLTFATNDGLHSGTISL